MYLLRPLLCGSTHARSPLYQKKEYRRYIYEFELDHEQKLIIPSHHCLI
jgi:hypothetical protein